MWTVTVFALFIAMLVTGGSAEGQEETSFSSFAVPAATTVKDWWETASFYQIYPRSFKDSNGDGIGDLNGVREKLPYLKCLGITATWLSPIFLSPMADFGYDIQDFFSIQPEYGTMADFDALIEEAKRQDIKIILDFVPNHSSDKNEWFIKSANKEEGWEDFYIWHPGYTDPSNSSNRLPPNNWLSVFRGSAWEWNAQRQEFYLHQFAVQQPDLNYRNPKVVDMMKSVLRFWLDRGVAGYRVDAVPHLFEVLPDDTGRYPDEPLSGDTTDPLDFGYLRHIYTQSQNETFDMVYQWRELLDEYKTEHGGDTRVMLTEAYVDIDLLMEFYDNGDGRNGSHIPMNFYLIMNLFRESTAADFKVIIDLWMSRMQAGRTPNWVLGNHDQRRIASRFGVERIDLLSMIIQSLPGASITYMGEEIGMKDVWISWEETVDPQACNTNKDVYDAHSRDPARTPFQWDDSTSAGFSENSTTWLPVSPDYKLVNLKRQEGAKRSHIKVYRQLIALRKSETFRYGDLETFSLGDDEVLVLIRRLDSLHDTYVVVANIGRQTKVVDLSSAELNLSGSMVYEVVDSLSEAKPGSAVNASSVHIFPNESFILRIPATTSSDSYYKYEVVRDEH